MINGGFIEDSALCVSGGIYTTYWIELVMHFTLNTPIQSVYSKQKLNLIKANFKDPLEVIPTINEFYEILRYGTRLKNLIGCSSNNVYIINKINYFLSFLFY